MLPDKIGFLEGYVNEYVEEYDPKAFQFRMKKEDSDSYRLLNKIAQSPSKIFVAATWAHHSIGHDDYVSLADPDQGWGWLIAQGVSIMETDRPGRLLAYLRSQELHR